MSATKEKAIATEKEALEIVTKDGYRLKEIPSHLKTKAVVDAAIAYGTRYDYIPEQFRTFALCLDKCPEYGSDTSDFAHRYAEAWGISPSAFSALVKKGTIPSFKKVPEKLLAEVEVETFKFALNKDISNIGNLPKHLLHLITEFHAVKSFSYYRSYGYGSSTWEGTKFIELIPKSAMTKYAVKELQKVIHQRYTNEGRTGGSVNLNKIPKEYMTKELYMLAVKHNSHNLEHVPAEFVDKEMCEIAVEKSGSALKYVPEEIRNEFYIKAVKAGGLHEIPEEHRTDKLCVLAVEANAKQLEYVPEDKKSYSLCLEALEGSAEAFRFVPDKLIDDEILIRFVIAVLKKKYSNDWYINDTMKEGDKVSLLGKAFSLVCKEDMTKTAQRQAKKDLFYEVVKREPSTFGRLVVLSEDTRDKRWEPFHNTITMELCTVAFMGDEKNLDCIPAEFNKIVWKQFILDKK